MAIKKIEYGIGFKVDKTNLNSIKKELSDLQNMTLRELKLVNAHATMDDLKQIRAAATEIGSALEKSFNPQLNTTSIRQFNKELKTIPGGLQGIEQRFAMAGTQGTTAFRNITAQILNTQQAVKQTSKFLDSMKTTFINTIKWSFSSSIINNFTGSIQKAWNYTKALDTSLNDIRIVTGKSADEMEKFAKSANKAAKSLGNSTTAYTKASLIYYQQGLGEQDVAARTNVTVKAANVTGQSAAEVSEQLTAVWNGYKVVAEEAEIYVDKLAAVAASTAADLQELSEGMSKVASAANAMGVDIDQLTAQISTIVSVTRQDASSVGTALKTIFARMGDLKVDGVDEFGVSLGDVSGTLEKVGIQVLDQQGNLRDMGTVIEEVAEKWGTWTEAQQQAIAIAMAGKRQYNNLLALFENWDMYESALSTSQGSAGTLQKQQDIYMDSLEARLTQLSTAGEKVFDSFMDTDSMKGMIDTLTWATERIANIINGFGGGGSVILSVLGLISKKLNGDIVQGLSRIGGNFATMKSNATELAAQQQLISDYQNASDKAIQKAVELKKLELKYSKLLNEEEKQGLKTLISQTIETQNKIDLNEQKTKEAEAYYSKQFGNAVTVDREKDSSYAHRDKITGLPISGYVTMSEAANYLESKANNLQDDIKEGFNGQKAQKALVATNKADANVALTAAKATKELEKLNSSTEKLTDTEENRQKALKKYIESQEKLKNKIVELKNSNQVTQEQKNQLIKLEIDQARGTKNVVQVEEQLKKIMGEVAQKEKEYADQLRNHAQNEENLTKEEQERLEVEKKLQKQLGRRELLSETVNLIGTTMQLVSVYQSLSSISKTWQDETLSAGEKITQTITSVGMAAGTLVPVFSSSFKLITTKASEAGYKIQRAFGWISLVMAAASVVFGILQSAGVFEKEKTAYEKATEYANQAKEEAVAAKKAVADLKSEYESLMDTFDKYNHAKLALDEMRVGTEEWKAAVEDLNNEVLGLLEKYPELAQYITRDKNGVLSLSHEGQDVLTERKQDEIREAANFSTYMNNRSIVANNDMLRERGRANIASSFYNGAMIKLDSFKTVLELGKMLGVKGNYTQESIATALQNKSIEELEDLERALASNTELSDKTKDALLSTIQSQKDLTGEIAKNTEQIRLSNRKRYETEGEEKGYDGVAYGIMKDKSVDDAGGTEPITYTDYRDYLVQAGYLENKDDWGWVKDNGKWENVGSKINTSQDYEAVGNMVNAMLSNAGYTGRLSDSEIKELFGGKSLEAINSTEFSIDGKTVTLGQIANEIGVKESEKVEGIASKDLDKESERLKAKGISTSAAFFTLGYGEEEIDKYNFTMGELNALKTEELGTKGAEKLANYLTDFIGEADEILANTGFKASDENKKDMFANFTADDFQAFANNIKKAQLVGGGEAIKGIFEQFANDPEATKFINDALSKVDWTDANSVQEFVAALSEEGYVINENNAAWTSFINSMTDGTKRWIKDSQSVIDMLNEIKSITKDLSVGDIISDEEYKKLLKISPEIKDMFIKTADGYKSLVSGTKIDSILKKQYDGLKNIKTIYTEIEKAVNNSKVEGNVTGNFTKDTAKTFLESFKDNETFLNQINLTPERLEALLAEADSNDEEIAAAAITQLKDFAKSANQIVLDVQNGEFSSESAQELWASTFASSWSEVKDAIEAGLIDENVAKKAEQVWKNNYLSEGGYAGLETDKSADELEEWIITNRKLELDYLKEINRALEEMGKNIERAFGKNKLDLLEENIELTRENADKAKERQGFAEGKLDTETEFIAEKFADKDIFDENGNIDMSKLLDFRATLSENDDDKSDEWIDNYIETWDAAEDAASATREAYWGIVDAQVELVRYQQELQEKIRESQKEWLEFSQKFKDYATGDLDVFGEKSAADLINESFERFNSISESFSLDSVASAVGVIEKYLNPQLAYKQAVKAEAEAYTEYEKAVEKEDNAIDTYNSRLSEATNARNFQKWYTDKDIENKGLLRQIFGSAYDSAEATIRHFNEDSDQLVADIASATEERKLAVTTYFIKRGERAQAEATYNNSIASMKTSGNPYFTFQNGEALFDEAAWQEDTDKAFETTKSQLEELQAELQNLYDGYLQAQQELMDIYDKEIEKLSNINSILQSSADLWKIVGKGAEDYSSKLTSYYGEIIGTSKGKYDLAQTKLLVAQTEYQKVLDLKDAASEEMLDTVRANMAAATEEVLSSASDWLNAISTMFNETMSATLDDFVKEVTDNMDLAGITEAWELEKTKESRTLDDVNAAYEMNQFSRNVQKSIDETDNIAAQNKLIEMRAKQEEKLNKILEERGKLSQYDLDRANAEYELTLKQIALEEAQQTVSKMKLTRDASGNYTYQYVQDEDLIAKAEEELAAAENNLYNLDKERNQSLVDEYYSTMTEANTAIAEAMAAGDLERVKRLKKYYFDPDTGLLGTIQSELASASENLDFIGEQIMGVDWDSSLIEFTSAINDMDLGNLATEITNLITDAGGAMTTVMETVEGLLTDEDSPINASIGLLSQSMKSADEIVAETVDLMDATQKVLYQLPGLTGAVGVLADQLERYATEYQNWLNSQTTMTANEELITATENNTTAVGDLTFALQQYGLYVEDMKNGKLGDLAGYDRRDDGTYLAQKVEENQ